MNRNSWQEVQWRRGLVIYRHWAEIFGSSRERTAHQQVTIFKTACYTQKLLCLGTCLALEEKKYWKGIPAWGTLANVRSQKGKNVFDVLLHLWTEYSKATIKKTHESQVLGQKSLLDICHKAAILSFSPFPTDSKRDVNSNAFVLQISTIHSTDSTLSAVLCPITIHLIDINEVQNLQSSGL